MSLIPAVSIGTRLERKGIAGLGKEEDREERCQLIEKEDRVA